MVTRLKAVGNQEKTKPWFVLVAHLQQLGNATVWDSCDCSKGNCQRVPTIHPNPRLIFTIAGERPFANCSDRNSIRVSALELLLAWLVACWILLGLFSVQKGAARVSRSRTREGQKRGVWRRNRRVSTSPREARSKKMARRVPSSSNNSQNFTLIVGLEPNGLTVWWCSGAFTLYNQEPVQIQIHTELQTTNLPETLREESFRGFLVRFESSEGKCFESSKETATCQEP